MGSTSRLSPSTKTFHGPATLGGLDTVRASPLWPERRLCGTVRIRAGLLPPALAAALVLTVVPGGTPDRYDRGRLTGQGDRDDDAEREPRQTSDGEPGEIAAVIPTYLRSKPRIDNVRRWRIAPGVRFKRWDRTDARGQIRAYLVKIDPSVRG